MTLKMAPTEGGVSGPPKIKRNASRKNKKSWRKNVDMAQVEEYMLEKELDARIGDVSEKPDNELFILDTNNEPAPETKKSLRKQKKETKQLKCFALLNGLPGAPDPVGQRDRVRSAEERMNPIVKDKFNKLAKAGVVGQKRLNAAKMRAAHLKQRKETELDRKTRRRTKFDFDLWGGSSSVEYDPKEVGDDWVTPDTKVHVQQGWATYKPKDKTKRTEGTGSLLPAVEVPHPGTSYNPNLADHQDLLWKATMIELKKEKEAAKIQRSTTGMFPTRENAPNEQTYLQEMSEGIPELEAKSSNQDENAEEDKADGKEGEVAAEEGDQKLPQNKPKTRKQLRDRKTKRIATQKVKSKLNLKQKENEIFRIKSFNKEIKALEAKTVERQKKKASEAEAKRLQPTQLSSYKYEEPDMELQLPDEMTGNLRNLRAEGSILEDRYKSLQRRNIIETRIKQKTVHKLKRKVIEKRSHRMGWEVNPNQIGKQKRNKMRRMKQKQKSAPAPN